jgi:hypothetical protein
MKIIQLLLLVPFVTLGLSAVACADQARTKSQDDEWVPVKHLEFTADDVEGGLLGPNGELIVASERARHASLIEIREGFEAEIVKMLENQ